MSQMTLFYSVFKSILFHSIALTIITLAITICYVSHLVELDTKLQIDFEASFQPNKTIELVSGPIWFYYNKKDGKLLSSKPISNEEKTTLLSLYPKGEADLPLYISAVNELAYASNKKNQQIFSLILILGSLGGLLGVMIRSLSSFIFHSCFLKDIDMCQWWPWYYLRPVMGAGLGIVIVVLSRSQLLVVESPGELTGYWILGICILAGFATSEVTDRFYYAAKALFGSQS